MTKIKVKDLATELGVIYADLVTHASKELGLEIKGPLIMLDESDAHKLRETLRNKGSQFAIEEKRVASRVIRRRKVNAPETPVTTPTSDPITESSAAPSSLTDALQPLSGISSTQPPLLEGDASSKPAESTAPVAPTEISKRNKSYRALTVVESDLTAPLGPRKPVPISGGGAVALPRPVVSRREVVTTRELSRGKPYGKKKMALKKSGKATEITTPKAIKRIIKISGSITIGELAKRLSVKVSELIGKAMGMGMMVTINQTIDSDTASIMASEFSYEVENVAMNAEEMLVEEATPPADLKPRPPVVTVMGHVDHGKTSLLDAIRKTNVTKDEHGGITQHIGAYDVKHSKGHIIFLDTPGHEAFTAMRARGASVTDIVVLVVAADDGVMPQTKESINHSKAAKVPIIVAVNKIDKPEANSEQVKKDLTEFGLVSEAWGGDTIFVEVSAKTGQGINDLLDMVLLQADVMELKASPDKSAKGIIIESQLDRGRGAVATVLIQEGTLHIGDAIVCGAEFGRVRSLMNDRGERVKEAGPSIPVEVVGLSGIVDVGETLNAVSDEKKARQVASVRGEHAREKTLDSSSKLTLDQLYSQIQKGETKEVKVVVKADVMGSAEAINETLRKLNTAEVSVNIIHSAVGGISESDVMLAAASRALIIGFNLRPDAAVSSLAEKEGVELRTYTIIYDMVEEIKKAMSGMLKPKSVEQVMGHMQIKETFNIGKVGTIGGGVVIDGRITRSARIRLLRDNAIVFEGQLASLKRFKDDAREVKQGLECGLSVANFNDIKIGDVIEAFEIVETPSTL